MCDTIRYSGTAPSHSFFAKNSDRAPSEPQALCLVPRRPPNEKFSIGDKPFPRGDAGYAFALSKPSWILGGEMGVNEKGVAIGNEAVFSRFKPARDGTLGMDILRAALAACATAAEAVDFICRFTEANDQGGNGAFRGSLYYDNSYLISDPEGAFILETAGRRWAWRAAYVRDAISNTYCIEDDFKRLDTQTRKEISPVNERAACSDEADPGRKGHKESFKGHVENRTLLRFSRGEDRRALSVTLLEGLAERPEAPSILDILGVLRAHGPYNPRHKFSRHMQSLCIHPGIAPNSATTASMAVEYCGPGSAVIWFSGTSLPCLSLYKPILLIGGEFLPLWTEYDYQEGSDAAYEYWSNFREWSERKGAGAQSLDPEFVRSRNRAQQSLVHIATRALSDAATSGGRAALSVMRQEAAAIVAGWEKDCGL